MTADQLLRELQVFVGASTSGLVQLLVAGAEKSVFRRIIGCPRYPVPTRTKSLELALAHFREVLQNPNFHLPTVLASLYAAAIPIDRRKRSGQFFTARPVAEW